MPADSSHEDLHALCWLLEANFLIFSETKGLKKQLCQKCVAYFKPLHLCKMFLNPCLIK